ncbi:MAG: hypothetical protein ACYCR7_08540 [Thermoplasmataceae archaeon]
MSDRALVTSFLRRIYRCTRFAKPIWINASPAFTPEQEAAPEPGII